MSAEEENHCYICLGPPTVDEKFIEESLCNCTGSIKLHWNCFSEMFNSLCRDKCGICRKDYSVLRGIQKDYDGQKSSVIVFDKTERKIYSSQGSLLHEGYLIHGENHGIWKQYYDCGSLDSRLIEVETAYNYGVAHGPQRRYFQSGALQWEQTMVNGKRHGIRKEYDETGALIAEKHYDHGILQ